MIDKGTSTESTCTQADIKCGTRGRVKYRRILAGICLAACTLSMIPVIAPLHTRWFAAAAMKHVYSVIDSPTKPDWDQTTERGIAPLEITRRLESVTGDQWKIVVDNPDLTADLQDFAHEDLQHPSVAAFREATADLVPETFDVFEVARRVRQLTNHQTDFTGQDVWDCLASARQKRGFWCHHFCRLFGAVCTSRGYTTRIISLSCLGNHFDHAMCEIYVPEMGGWMVIDVDFEVAYRAGDRWLTAVELQQIWKSIRHDVSDKKRFEDDPTEAARRRGWIMEERNLEIVEFGQDESHLRQARFEVSPTGLNLELFEYVFLAVRDDYLSDTHPFGHPYRIGQICFRADGADDLIEVCPEAHHVPISSAYAPIGRSHVRMIGLSHGPSLELAFTSSMANIEQFQVRCDTGDWTIVEDPQRQIWRLAESVNTLEVRAMNSQGVSGPVTAIRIEAL